MTLNSTLTPATHAQPTTWGWRRTTVMHLAPGVVLVAAAIVFGQLAPAVGVPPLWGLLAAVLAVQVPLLLLGARRLRPRSDDPSPRPRRSGRRSLRLAGVAVAVTAVGVVLPGAVSWAEPLLRTHVFGWLPDWWPSTGGLTAVPEQFRVATVVLWFAAAVVCGPIAEELYFRGAMLPRIAGRPWTAACGNAALFAAYHLWQPAAVFTVFLATVPIAVTRRVYGLPLAACCATHCLVNAAAMTLIITGALGAGR